MQRKLENRNVLITGASRGIGRAIAIRFAEEGANVLICARNLGPLQKTAEEIHQLGAKVVPCVADVCDGESVRKMVRFAQEELGAVDTLVNNAGAHKITRFLDCSIEDFDDVVKRNLYGTFLVTQSVLPGMVEHQKGKIINIASTAGKWGTRNQCAYNASKHAVVGLTRGLALEMATYGINVNAICPWVVETDMSSSLIEQQANHLGITQEEATAALLAKSPMRRFLQPEEIAHLALYLASAESDGMTGQSLVISGGYLLI